MTTQTMSSADLKALRAKWRKLAKVIGPAAKLTPSEQERLWDLAMEQARKDSGK